MKTPLFFILLFSLLIVSCKKKSLKPPVGEVTQYMIHSGSIDSKPFSLVTPNISSKLITMSQYNGPEYRNFRIQTLLRGSSLQDFFSSPDEILLLNLSLQIPYSVSEFDPNCNCFPTPNAERLAYYINHPSFDWNDNSNNKRLFVIAWNNQTGNGYAQPIDANISAEVKGDLIRIHGTVSSLVVPSNRLLKKLSFDYCVPIEL